MVVKNGKEPRWAKLVKINIKNEYGAGIIEYIYNWTFLLEEELRKRNIEVKEESLKTKRKEIKQCLNEVAKITEGMADTMGMSGASFGMALVSIKEVWIFGEVLGELYDERGFFVGDKK